MIITQHEKRSGAICLEAKDTHNNTLASMTLDDMSHEVYVDYASYVGSVTAFWEMKGNEIDGNEWMEEAA